MSGVTGLDGLGDWLKKEIVASAEKTIKERFSRLRCPVHHPTISRRMIDLSIRLDHFAAIPVDQTLKLQRDVDKSLVAMEALRYLVFNRFYFFTAPYDVKQRLCSKLGIKLQPILLDRDPKRDA